MSERKNARSTAATAERVANEVILELNGAQEHYSGFRPSRQQWVSGILGRGAGAALTAQEITAIIGLSDVRVITKEIERERAEGCPICATVCGPLRGYFLAETVGELEGYVKSLRRRVRSVQKTEAALEKTLRAMSGQQIMEGWGND